MYRYPYFGISTSAIRAPRLHHSGSVGLIGPHYIACASMVGVIPPMEPAIKFTGRGGRQEGGVRGLVRRNRHTGVKPLHGLAVIAASMALISCISEMWAG